MDPVVFLEIFMPSSILSSLGGWLSPEGLLIVQLLLGSYDWFPGEGCFNCRQTGMGESWCKAPSSSLHSAISSKTRRRQKVF